MNVKPLRNRKLCCNSIALLVSLIGIVSMTYSQSWDIVQPAAPEPSMHEKPWNDIFFIGENIGWVVGETDTILHTEDGGDSWSVQKSPKWGIFKKIQFADAQHGWAIAKDTLGGDFIITTNNQGATWNLLTTLPDWATFLNASSKVSYSDFQYFSSGDAWLVGKYTTGSSSNFIICNTKNHFATWKIDTFQNKTLNQIYFLNNNDVWARIDTYRCLKTFNGATDYQQDTLMGYYTKTPHIFNVPIPNLTAFSKDTLCVIVFGGQVWHTFNGGTSWVKDSKIDTALYDIEIFHHTPLGEMTGMIFNGKHTRLAKSTDFGQTWKLSTGLAEYNRIYKNASSGGAGYPVQDPSLIYPEFSLVENTPAEIIFKHRLGNKLVAFSHNEIGNIRTLLNYNRLVFATSSGLDITIPNNLVIPDIREVFPTWQAIPYSSFFYGSFEPVFSRIAGYGSYVSQQNLWILGNRSSILRWNESENDVRVAYPVQGFESNLFRVNFQNPQTAIAVGTFGKILRSGDSGINWSEIPSQTNAHLYGITWANQNTAWVVGANGTLLKSTDAGLSFQPVTIESNQLFSHFLSIASRNDTIKIGGVDIIYESSDGGNTWTKDTLHYQDSVLEASRFRLIFFHDVKSADIFFSSKIPAWQPGKIGRLLVNTSSNPAVSIAGQLYYGLLSGRFISSSGYFVKGNKLLSSYALVHDLECTIQSVAGNCCGYDYAGYEITPFPAIFGDGFGIPVDMEPAFKTGIMYAGPIQPWGMKRTRDNWETSVFQDMVSSGTNDYCKIEYLHMIDSCTAWLVGKNGFIARYNPPMPICNSYLIYPQPQSNNNPLLPLISWKCSNQVLPNGQAGIIDGYYLSLGSTPGANDILFKDIHVDTTYQLTDSLPAGKKIWVTIQPYNCKGVAQACQLDWFITECASSGSQSLQTSITIDSATCTSVDDGEIHIVISGGTPDVNGNYSIQILYVDGGYNIVDIEEDTTIIYGVPVGTYQVFVEDENGCQTLTIVEVPALKALSIASVVQQSSCPTSCNGSISVIGVTNGGQASLPYAFNWSGIPSPPTSINTDTSSNLELLCAGSYSVVMQDTNGCSVDTTFLITPLSDCGECPPTGLPAAADQCLQAPLLCSGIDGYCGTLDTSSASQPFPGCSNWVLNNDEWIAFVAGSSTISIQITPWNCSSSNTPGLQAGIYKSCISEILDLQCSPAIDPFVLQSSDFLVGQKYYLVFDGGDNSTCGYTVDVLQGSTVALSADLPDTTICSGDTIAPSISGGTLSNLFLWNTGETSASIVPANAGIYTVTITDSNGCTVVESATIGVEPQPCNNNCPPPGFSLPGDSCTQAPVMCNGIDGYCGTLDSIGIIQNFPDCFGGSLYNDEWIAFVAGDTLISIEVTPSDCQAPSGLPGMQGAIYEGSCDGNTIATQCDGTTDPFLLTAASFVPGKVYYLVLDGLIDSYCDYSIKVLSGSTAPVPPQAPDGPYGTADVCPGATVTYSLGNPNAAIFNWTLSPPGIGTFIPPVQGGQVDIFWSMEGTAQLCVTASNPCANPSPPSCITIEAKNISTSTEFHQLYLGDCVECAGQTFCAPGTYPVTLESWLGCDSTIICEISAACTDQFAGTISFANFTGQSNDIDLDTIYLCYNDAIDIIHNGDANLTGDPNPVTQPGITYGFFDCPPTISGYNLTNILSDPCILDTPPPANGIWVASGGSPAGHIDFFNNGIPQNLFNNGDPVMIWFAPMTIDNFSIKGFENNPLPPFNLGPCVNVSVDEAFAVVYLNEIEVSSLQLDNFGCGGSFTLKGGLPEFDGSAYEIAIYQQANPAIQGQVFTNNPTHGQSVSFSVPAPGIYEVLVEDGKSCKVNMEVTVNCNCISSAGTMDLTPIISCASQTVTAIYDDTGEVYDPDDILYFYLHEGSGNTLVNPISFSGTPTFSFQPGMSYGVTYYISAVVGSWAGNGVDLTDPCLSVAPGTPVVFTTGLNGAALSAPDTICAGSEALLVASGGDTYTWNVSGATVSSLPYYPQTSGTVSVTISDSATGCDTTISHFIFVKSVASVQIGCDNPLCVGDKDTLCTSGSAVAFLWNDGSVQQTLLVQPTATTQYWVTGFKPNHCPGSDSVTIVVAQPPVADAGGDQITCTDAAMLQTSPPPGALLEWFDLTGAFVENPDAASTPVHDLMPGENLFQLTVQTPPCPGEALDTVTVFYANEAAQVMDDQSHTNLNTVLEMNVLANDGLSAALTYELRLIEQDDNGTWQLSSNGVLHFEPTSGFSGIAAARYEVCNTACDTVCGEAAITIKVLKPEDDIGETQVITPNGDGKNDELIFDYLDQYPDNSIVIFNRWGDVVFQHKPYENDWVGTYNGGALPTGTYYYVLNLKGDDNLIWGNVLLIR